MEQNLVQEDDGSFAEALKNQQSAVSDQISTDKKEEEDIDVENDPSVEAFTAPSSSDFEDAEDPIPEDQQRPVVETSDGQKNSTHLRDDVEEKQSDSEIIETTLFRQYG